MEGFARDIRQALRNMPRSAGFTLLAVLTLALGIGATTAIFTVLNAVVLSPLPYPDSERLVRIENRVPGVGPEASWGLSPAGYFHFRDESRSLEELAVYLSAQTNLTGGGQPERVQAAIVSGGMFDVLRARPAHGRLLTAEDDRPGTDEPGVVLPGPAEQVAVLGHAFWARRFGGDPGIVGQTIQIDGVAVPVVGVLAPGIDLPTPGVKVDVWMPLGLNPAGMPTNWHSFQAIGRLRDGVTAASAQAEFQQLTNRFTELFPSAYSAGFMEETGFTPVVTPLREAVVGELSRTLWVLLGAVGLVLLIACANVANLFLVRTEGRRRELAIRTAMGATRGRLARLFLTEGVVLALLGGMVGLLLAYVGVRGLIATAPAGLPRLDEIRITAPVVGFALLLSVVVGLAVGSFPLLRFGWGVSPGALREAGRGATAGRERNLARNLLVMGQMAMALVLLAAAGLLLQSFERLRSVDPGLDPAGVLTMELTLPFSRYQSYQDVSAFYEEFTARVAALPGVQHASVSTSLPLTGGVGCAAIFVEERPPTAGSEPPCVPYASVSPAYFASLRIPVAGTTPGWNEINRGSGEVVVSRALADRLWPGQDPIGKGVRPNGWREPYYQVAGVTGDVRYEGLDQPPTEIIYYPLRPMEGAPLWSPQRAVTLVVRTQTSHPEALTGTIRNTLAALDPEVPLANVRTMEAVIGRSVARTSFAMLLLGIAAAVALLLGAVGLYGVISYVVGQRRKEIGIRMALGAHVDQVAGMVVRQSLWLALGGVVVGVAAAVAVTRVLRTLLFEVSPSDPLTLLSVSLLLIAVALLASWLPARRATRVDPMIALRSE